MKKETESYNHRWDRIAGTLVRYPLLMRYTDLQLCPTDQYGFRLLTGRSPFEILVDDKFFTRTYLCIGGSTTFGWFVNYEHSYPALLAHLTNKRMLNLGIPGLDVKNCLEVLTNILRFRTRNIVLIFLFGVNEKSGFLQMNNLELDDYVVTHNLYSKLDKNYSRTKLSFLKKNSPQQTTISDERYNKFLQGQIDETYSFIKLIKDICDGYKIKSYFFLQPHGLSKFRELENTERANYLDDLYSGLRTKKEVIDISNICKMAKFDFIDWQHPNQTGYEKISKAISNLL